MGAVEGGYRGLERQRDDQKSRRILVCVRVGVRRNSRARGSRPSGSGGTVNCRQCRPRHHYAGRQQRRRHGDRPGRRPDARWWLVHFGEPARDSGHGLQPQLPLRVQRLDGGARHAFPPVVNGEVDAISGPAANGVTSAAFTSGVRSASRSPQPQHRRARHHLQPVTERNHATGPGQQPAVCGRHFTAPTTVSSINPSTGALTTTSVFPHRTPQLGTRASRLNVMRVAASGSSDGYRPSRHPDDHRRQLHRCRPAGGTSLPRDQIANIILGSTSATVDPNWKTNAYTAAASARRSTRTCAMSGGPRTARTSWSRRRAVWPNTTGPRPVTPQPLRNPWPGRGRAPTWIDFTGHDSLYSVAVTGRGLRRWPPALAEQPVRRRHAARARCPVRVSQR